MNAMKLVAGVTIELPRATTRLLSKLFGSARRARTTPTSNIRARLDLTAFEGRYTPAALTVLVETPQPALVRVIETDSASSFTGITVNDRFTAITTGQQDGTPTEPSAPYHKINRGATTPHLGNAIDSLKVTAPVTKDEVGNGPTKHEVLNDATQKNVPADTLAAANTPLAPSVNHDRKHRPNPKPPTVHGIDSLQATAPSAIASVSKAENTGISSKGEPAQSKAGHGGAPGAQAKDPTASLTEPTTTTSASVSKADNTGINSKGNPAPSKAASGEVSMSGAKTQATESKTTTIGHDVSSESAPKAAGSKLNHPVSIA